MEILYEGNNYPADKKKTEKLIEVLSLLEVVSIIDMKDKS
jgi:hypothetical protein